MEEMWRAEKGGKDGGEASKGKRNHRVSGGNKQ